MSQVKRDLEEHEALLAAIDALGIRIAGPMEEWPVNRAAGRMSWPGRESEG